MDTKKVGELLQKILNAEAKQADLEKFVMDAQNRFEAQKDLVSTLKRELVGEFGDMLAVDSKKTKTKKAQEPGKRTKGMSATILTILSDGHPRGAKDIQPLLAQQGIPATNLSIALCSLAKQGRIERVGRGQYAKR